LKPPKRENREGIEEEEEKGGLVTTVIEMPL
jgi:hypothetical protein